MAKEKMHEITAETHRLFRAKNANMGQAFKHCTPDMRGVILGSNSSVSQKLHCRRK